MRGLSNAARRLEGHRMPPILSRAKELEIKEIIHFELGNPDFETPENITAACIESLKRGMTNYSPSGGLMEVIRSCRESDLAF